MDRPRTHRLRLRRAVAAVFAAATPLCLAAAAWADEAATASADAAANAAAMNAAAMNAAATSAAADPATAIAWINTARLPLLVALVIICGSVVAGNALARSGRPLRIRRLAALHAVDEAIGRATEMGRSVLFVPGIQDMTEIQTVAGVTVLGRVARTAAEYDARLEVPTSRSIVMAAARETVQAAHFTAGRPETYNESNIYYITDEQFGYVAAVTGKMVREKPAACFYMGAFYAESLLFAENGNSIGAIQIAGTAEPSQLPFFVAACDYTLIGEEFFAASAYLSGERDQLGSVKGQDLGKLWIAAAILLGCALATAAVFVPSLAGAAASFKAILGG